jgi:hypothetical protein
LQKGADMKNILTSIGSAFVLTLALGACGAKQQPAAQTTTHTETTTSDPNGHATTDMDTQHTVKQDGTTVDKTTETTKAVTPAPSPGY